MVFQAPCQVLWPCHMVDEGYGQDAKFVDLTEPLLHVQELGNEQATLANIQKRFKHQQPGSFWFQWYAHLGASFFFFRNGKGHVKWAVITTTEIQDKYIAKGWNSDRKDEGGGYSLVVLRLFHGGGRIDTRDSALSNICSLKMYCTIIWLLLIFPCYGHY